MRPPRAEGQVASRAGGAGPSALSGAGGSASNAALQAPGRQEASGGRGPHRARVSSGLRRPPTRDPGGPFGGGSRTAPAGHAEPAGRTHRRPEGRADGGGTAPATRGSSCGGRVLYFCCSSGDLSKGKDVRGGGSGCRRVSRDLGGTLAQFEFPRLAPTRPSAGGESDWGGAHGRGCWRTAKGTGI